MYTYTYTYIYIYVYVVVPVHQELLHEKNRHSAQARVCATHHPLAGWCLGPVRAVHLRFRWRGHDHLRRNWDDDHGETIGKP